MTHRIAVIAGDGIGPEVITEALKVARAAGADLDTVDYDLGGRRYLATGEVLPDSVLGELRGFDAILLGAIGTPEVPPGVLERGLLLRNAPHLVRNLAFVVPAGLGVQEAGLVWFGQAFGIGSDMADVGLAMQRAIDWFHANRYC